MYIILLFSLYLIYTSYLMYYSKNFKHRNQMNVEKNKE